MLISTRNKFIFFHVPKVAGSSINSALRKYSNLPSDRLYNYLFDLFGQVPHFGVFYRHISPFELRSLLRKKEHFDEAFKFAFVRNTWDWHVSQFHFHKQNEKFGIWHKTFVDMEFDQYVDWAVEPQNIEKTFSAQKKFLSSPEGELMVDFVGRIENIDEDFKTVCEKIGLEVELPTKNKSKRKSSYHEYYDEDTRNKIANAFEEDIQYFGFEF